MIIKVDIRERDLLAQLNQLILNVPIFKQLIIKSETLPLGDIIITDDADEEKLIIERKSVSDLLASIKDGRYEEQSYRLNGLNHHNHNIIYLIEGDVNRINRFKTDNKVEKLTSYSAMFSLNYFKGFSVFRTFSLEETAIVVCNMAYKLEKEVKTDKKAFYTNIIPEQIKPADEPTTETYDADTEDPDPDPSVKNYVNVIKKVKKENITPENIGEIMLCQIPGISSITAIAIMQQYKSLPHLIKEIENNNDCLKNISYTNPKGQTRKMNKTSIANIVKFLLKK